MRHDRFEYHRFNTVPVAAWDRSYSANRRVQAHHTFWDRCIVALAIGLTLAFSVLCLYY